MFDSILLQASGGGVEQIIFFVAIIVIFYFFMIRPQQKKQKDTKKFISELKKGDRVVTIGGLHGKIFDLPNDDTVVVEVERGFKLTFERSAISLENSKRVNEGSKKDN
ncbi:preprotein translocase subunit YajC [Marinigracilibium pacificum]|uniref:Sec translocon accessory complex subunit YajC n=1 Tax=Marinigracilibium pacificum TaxID=2729599 RepID=A0A848IX75_9BACT|nr:preprotein translocase subunit YajC [Marinigracilibium pacificum]NMM46860.1 preprotein translocase subunit YajC [Marinigracilibium pacificum]